MRLGQSWVKVGSRLGQGWIKVGLRLAQRLNVLSFTAFSVKLRATMGPPNNLEANKNQPWENIGAISGHIQGNNGNLMVFFFSNFTTFCYSFEESWKKLNN